MRARRRKKKKRLLGIIFMIFFAITSGVAIGLMYFAHNGSNLKASSWNQQKSDDTGVDSSQTENTADDTPKDTEPPLISGVRDQTVYIGDTVSYKKDVTVTDNVDKDVKLEVDSSAVNLKKAGTYSVTYSATDSSGNTATKKAAFKVAEKPKETSADTSGNKAQADKLADEVLSKIIKDGMSQKDKAKEIYHWTKSNIGYVDHSDKSDWVKGAIQGLSKGSGDCFVYFATAKELLTRAGIQNQDIIKVDGHHYWNLVNCGSGWYHFDTTPRKGDNDFYSLFMLTDAQIKAYSSKHGKSHVWDASKYPATPAK